MNLIFLTQAVLMVAGCAALYALSTPFAALSYLTGSGVVFMNFVFLAIGWTLIFRKKLVALAGSLIVIKYAILGLLLYYVIHQPWLDLVWFAVGVASFMGAALNYAFAYASAENSKENSKETAEAVKGQHGV